ncbi:MAG: hypothetical protein HC830_15550, partial [Bacteroidetes bacterium]|nr:hypothetical protein [Bacteroidota bacterium]
MSKRTFFKRYIWLYDLISNNPGIDYKTMEDRFFKAAFRDEYEAGFSKSTFNRDKKEITELFGIVIEFDHSLNGYVIAETTLTQHAQMLLNSFRFINTAQIFVNSGEYFSAEPLKTGSEHLLSVLEAILQRNRLEFNYKNTTGNREM